MPELTTSVQITNGPFTAEATHDRFGITVQSWNAPKVVSYICLGADAEDQLGFTVMEGVRDSGEPATSVAEWEDDDYAAAVQLPEIQAALEKLREIHEWIIGGRTDPFPE